MDLVLLGAQHRDASKILVCGVKAKRKHLPRPALADKKPIKAKNTAYFAECMQKINSKSPGFDGTQPGAW